jgi:hypothetical protein
MRTITLSDEDALTLTLMCGYATAGAMEKGQRGLSRMFARLTNQLHEGRPNWIPLDLDAFGAEEEQC